MLVVHYLFFVHWARRNLEYHLLALVFHFFRCANLNLRNEIVRHCASLLGQNIRIAPAPAWGCPLPGNFVRPSARYCFMT